ncbi:MAG: DUF4430 domain-containing protein [Clostridia bacterium]|nr:DUF4430 domain-containing protein [Clostridia bacterium]
MHFHRARIRRYPLPLRRGRRQQHDGLYIKTVNGITLDFDKDGKYWAFYENGNYAAKSADQTPVKNGGTYAFKAES